MQFTDKWWTKKTKTTTTTASVNSIEMSVASVILQAIEKKPQSDKFLLLIYLGRYVCVLLFK